VWHERSDRWLRATPAARIAGAQLTLRRWDADDADDLCAAVTESLDRLEQWAPWAAGYDLAAAGRFLETSGQRWRSLSGFDYAVVDTTGRILGGAALHPHITPGGLGIGYWIRAGATRRHVATRAAALLTAEAFTVDGVTYTEIRHDRANEISGRIPRRLGYDYIGTAPRERLAPGHSGVELRWRMTSKGYASSMARTLAAG
jgi:ribosomal-protein-serine acetyltransferase